MTKQADLVAYVFEGQPHLLSRELSLWMEDSARFTTFVETYRDKIRKKVRLAREPETALDLRGELEVAYCLLSDRRFDVDYEPYASAKHRGPDFSVTYRVNTVFNIEVARIRLEESSESPRKGERFLRLLLYKLGQMRPGMPNLLVIHAHEKWRRSLELNKFMQDIKLRVEKRDPDFYELSHYASPAAFYKDFLHLSAILLWAAAPGTQLWANKQARPALASEVLNLVGSLSSTVQNSL